MRTPAGSECPYFYGNYYRGHNQEECRLLDNPASADHWTRDLCKTCPVPSIHLANACKNMVLQGRIERGFLGLRKRVQVTAFCKKSNEPVAEPHIGCGHCHEIPPAFLESPK